MTTNSVCANRLSLTSIEARAQLAMSRVMEPIDSATARQYLNTAEAIAGAMGRVAFDGDGPDQPFLDEPALHKAWEKGIYYEGMRQSAEFAAES